MSCRPGPATLAGTLLAALWMAQVPLAHASEPAPTASALPDDSSARDALEHAPAIVAAREFLVQGQAQQSKRAAGPHEWELLATNRRRTERSGTSYLEQEFELAHGVRLPGKRSLDREIGQQLADNGEFAFEDAWHEAGRTLLAGWFNWLRAERMTLLRARLRDTQQDVVASVARRVRAGDAPDLEQRLARSELQRAEYELAQSRQAAQIARAELLRDYPTLQLRVPAVLPDPTPLAGSDQEWTDRIVKSNHEIKLADGQAAAANMEAQRARLERMADPSFSLIYSDNFDQMRNTVGMRVSVRLGGAARRADAALAASSARVAAAEAQLAALRVGSDARKDLANRQSYLEQWLSLADAARQAQQNAEAYARGYSNGEFDLVTLLNVQQVAAQARLAAETAQLNALEADARLRIDAHQLWTPDEDED